MAEKSLSLAKIKAYDDTKRMIRFLHEEQESIEGARNKREFFRKNIEQVFENNFKNKIPIEEFESIIFDICIAKSLIMGDTDEKKLYRRIEDAVLQFNIRSKDLLSEKISMAIASDPSTRGRIKAFIDQKYKEVVSPMISGMIRKLIPEQEIDSREIITKVKEERFDLDTVSISKIFTKELKSYQDIHKKDLRMKRGPGKGTDIKRDRRAPGAKTAVEKMNVVVSREKERKEKFIGTLDNLAFKLGETYMDDNTRVFVHTANYRQMRIVIISYAVEGEIDNVSILFESAQGGRKAGELFFDLGELQALDERVVPTFIKSKLGLFSKVLGIPGILEAIWFLSSVLTAERKLPFKTVEFMQDNLLVYLEPIETEIHRTTVQEAIQSQ